ncbi:MAG: amidohydrolase family protein [Bacteroidota bacterium]
MKKIILFTLIISNIIFASDQIPGKKQVKPIVITNAKIFTITNGVIENGMIIFEKGKITSIGKDLNIPKDAEVIDASGKYIYPGLFNANSEIGLVEIQAVRATKDLTETGKFNPNARAEIALNPDSDLFPTTRANGILLAHVLPKGITIPGRSSVAMLDGWTQEDLILKSDAGIILEWPNMKTNTSPWMMKSEEEQKKERDKTLKEIKQFFTDARAYKIAKESNKYLKTDLRFEAMSALFDKNIPLMIVANDIFQIESAIEFCDTENIKMILVGGLDSWRVAELLKRKNISVILNKIYDEPMRDWESYDNVFSLPSKLLNSGVKFAISANGEAMAERNLPNIAATAVAFGLNKDEALKAITIYPSQILNVDDKVGSLEVGKDATLFISNGDIFEIQTKVEIAFIQGKKVDLSSHHTKLYDKYREKYKQIGLIK